LPDESRLDATAEVRDDQLAVTFTVPGGLAPDGARLAVEIRAGDAAVAEAPVALHADPAPSLAGAVGDRTGQLGPDEIGDLRAICHQGVVDADEDGVFEVLMLGVDGDGRGVFRGCVGFVDPTTGDWECEDDALEVDTGGGGLLCGETDHFMTAGGTGGIGGVLTTAAGAAFAVRNLEWNGTGWGEPGEVTRLASFAVVLGMNTSKEKGADPLEAVLGMQPAGGDEWTGVFVAGAERFEWADLDGVTPTQVGAGQAWAGLFTTADLRGPTAAAVPTPPSWAWAALPEGDVLRVSALGWSAGDGAFQLRRRIFLESPGFRVEAMAAAGEDLDDDGTPELVVEAWGEGRYAAWLVPSATDDGAGEPVTRLRSRLADAGTFGALARVREGGRPPRVRSSFAATRSGTLSAVRAIPDGPADGATPPALVYLLETWDAAEALNPDRFEARASGAGVLGKSQASTGSGPGSATRTRIEIDGTATFISSADCLSSTRLPSGGGDPLGDTEVSVLAADNPLFVSPEGVTVNAIAGDADFLGGLAPSLGTTVGLALTAEPGAFAVRLDGADVAPATPTARFGAFTDDAGNAAVCVFEVSPAARAGDDDPATATVRVDIRVRYADQTGSAQLPAANASGGSTVPVILDAEVSPDGGLLLGWRDGAGQAWVGAMDVAAAAAQDEGPLPFLEGPVAVGEPVDDREGALGLSVDHAGLVGVQTRPTAGSTLLDLADQAARVADWDAPMEGDFTRTDAAYGPFVLVVGGTEPGRHALAYAPAVDDLSELALETVVSGVPNEALPVPRLAASVLPDAPQLLVSTTAEGAVTLDLVDDRRPLARTTTGLTVPPAMRERVSAGDLNGDGLADVVFGSGVDAVLWASDGAGGALDVTVPRELLVNFAGFVGGADRTREAALNAAEGGSFGPIEAVIDVAYENRGE
jgi:hypothetical protein